MTAKRRCWFAMLVVIAAVAVAQSARAQRAPNPNPPRPQAEPTMRPMPRTPGRGARPAMDGKATTGRGGRNPNAVQPPRKTWIVRPPAADLLPAADVAQRIDAEIQARLASENVPSSPLCDDAEFVRRAYLDITGVIPTAEEAVAFLDIADADKRARLIDKLLDDLQYGRYFGELWSERIVPHDLPTNKTPLIEWFADAFNQSAGWDDVVFELISAGGNFTPIRLRAPGLAHDPPATFLLANSEDNQPRPDRLAGAAAALFLGVQIQCAECHDHPFAQWKQTEFWGLAAFFGQLRTERTDQPPALAWQDSTLASQQPAQIVIPTTALREVGTAVPARFLGDESPPLVQERLLRTALARWMTSPDNPWFARAAANRMWAHLFGRGLVHPVDDMHGENPPSHPAILELLASELVKSKFDQKYLIRCITLSQTYQRSSRPPPENGRDEAANSRAAVRVLPPGVLYDSLTRATGFRELQLGLPRSKSKQGVTTQLFARDAFIDFFRTQDEPADPTEYSHGIPQALKLLNSPQLNQVAPLAARLAHSGVSRDATIEQLYLSVLARRPSADEAAQVADFLDRRQQRPREDGYNAVLWALVNSSEFVLNR